MLARTLELCSPSRGQKGMLTDRVVPLRTGFYAFRSDGVPIRLGIQAETSRSDVVVIVP